MATELTVILEDRPGALAALCTVLGDAGVNIGAIQGTTRTGHGVVQFVPNNPERAAQSLAAAGIAHTRREVARALSSHRPRELRRCRAAGALEPNHCRTQEAADARAEIAFEFAKNCSRLSVSVLNSISPRIEFVAAEGTGPSVDSYSGRGIKRNPSEAELSRTGQVIDLYRALSLLTTHPRIDPKK